MASSTEPQAKAYSIGARTQPFAGVSVLVVDNDLARHIGSALEHEGFGVASAHDGIEALEALSGQTFDVVVLNYRMPRMNGAVALRHLRERGDLTPVIMISAWDVDDIPEPIDDLDLCDYLEKPFPTELLVRCIGQCLARPKTSASVLTGDPQ